MGSRIHLQKKINVVSAWCEMVVIHGAGPRGRDSERGCRDTLARWLPAHHATLDTTCTTSTTSYRLPIRRRCQHARHLSPSKQSSLISGAARTQFLRSRSCISCACALRPVSFRGSARRISYLLRWCSSPLVAGNLSSSSTLDSVRHHPPQRSLEE